MDSTCLILSLISIIAIVIVTIVLVIQYYRLKYTFVTDLESVVSQINDVNSLNLNINKVQDSNIQSLDNNLNMLRSKVNLAGPSAAVQGSEILVKRNTDQSISVCKPDGTSCRTL